MFSFGNKAYVQLEKFQEPDKAHVNGTSPTRDVEGGTSTSNAMSASPTTLPSSPVPSANMGGDSGRVQVPIGMVSDSRMMRQWQVMALLAFSLIQVILFIALCILTLVLDGYGRLAVVALGGSTWLGLLLFNLRLAGRPRLAIQWFLQNKTKTRLSSRLKRGQLVVIRGAVSLLHEELLSTEFHNVPGLVLVESSLRSYHPGSKSKDAWTEHVRQTRAVDFRITDALSGGTALVRAFSASEAGAATPLVHISTEVPLSTAVPIMAPNSVGSSKSEAGSGPKPIDTDERRRRRIASAPQLMVCKGYIRQGQVVTVMGEITEVPGSSELCITALSRPHNVSKFLLFRGFVPFFFPTWVSGLVISDQRDLA